MTATSVGTVSMPVSAGTVPSGWTSLGAVEVAESSSVVCSDCVTGAAEPGEVEVSSPAHAANSEEPTSNETSSEETGREETDREDQKISPTASSRVWREWRSGVVDGT